MYKLTDRFTSTVYLYGYDSVGNLISEEQYGWTTNAFLHRQSSDLLQWRKLYLHMVEWQNDDVFATALSERILLYGKDRVAIEN